MATKTTHSAGDASAIAELTELFQRNGYVRRADDHRRDSEGSTAYKKGDEIRLAASSSAELARIRKMLVALGFKPGRPFQKGKQFRQPLYGREEVARFLKLVGSGGRPRKAAKKR
jgi:hypothetical protein